MVCGNDNTYGLNCLKQLNGKKYIILGNHDSATRAAFYQCLTDVINVSYAGQIKYNKFIFYLSHYPTYTGNDLDKNIHSTLINLHGHTHSKEKFFDNKWFMYNIGLDSHNNYPVEIEEILEDIRQKKNELNILKMKGEL